jgi:hypothetical protein
VDAPSLLHATNEPRIINDKTNFFMILALLTGLMPNFEKGNPAIKKKILTLRWVTIYSYMY